jgi:hypothetical protein
MGDRQYLIWVMPAQGHAKSTIGSRWHGVGGFMLLEHMPESRTGECNGRPTGHRGQGIPV